MRKTKEKAAPLLGGLPLGQYRASLVSSLCHRARAWTDGRARRGHRYVQLVRVTATAPRSSVLTADPTHVAVDPILHVTVACLC